MAQTRERLAFLVLALVFINNPLSGALYQEAPNSPFSVGNGPSGIWLGNLRGDGNWRDIAVANSADDTVNVLLFLGAGNFAVAGTYPVGDNPQGLQTEDLNGDGYEDIIVANHGDNNISVLMNLGRGLNFATRTDYSVGQGPQAVNAKDVSGDGRADVLVANQNGNSVSVLLGSGGGLLNSAVSYSVGLKPNSIQAADLDGDGVLDILTANYDDDTLTILPGIGNGTFDVPNGVTVPLPANGKPTYALSGDSNGDRTNDFIAVALDQLDEVVILLPVAGAWTAPLMYEYALSGHPQSLLVRDVNRDGIPDVVAALNNVNKIAVWLGSVEGGSYHLTGDPNNNGAVFEFAAGSGPAIVVGSNLNGDRTTDVAVTDSGANTVKVLLYGAPLADNLTMRVFEDTPTNVALRGHIVSGGPLVYITNTLPSHGTLSGPTDNLTYTPAPDFFGADTFTYSATDGSLTSILAVATLNITPVNDAPSFDLSQAEVNVVEDSPVVTLPNFAVNISKGPANEAGQYAAFLVSCDHSKFASVPTITSAGTLRFWPALNVHETVPVTVQLRDTGGTVYGGVNLSAPQEFDIIITPNPLKPAKGQYNGLFYETGPGGKQHASSGFFTFKVTASGTSANGNFTGKMTGDGGTYPFSGQFDLDGQATIQVVRVSRPALTMELALDLPDANSVTGSVYPPGQPWQSDLLGYRSTTNSPAPEAGQNTMVFPGDCMNSATVPGGDGYATIKVTSTGAIRATGKVADNSPFSQGTFVSRDGQWPFYIPLYHSQGSMLGWLTFQPDHSIEGSVTWFKPSQAVALYPNGFTNQMSVIGSSYVAPTFGQRVLTLTDGTLTLCGGNLDAPNNPFAAAATLTDGNLVLVGPATYIALTSPSSGLMTGKFTHPTLLKTKSIWAVPLQQQNTVRGFFIGTDQTGSVLLAP